MSKSNMNFAVNEESVLCNIMSGEIRARIISKRNSSKKELYKKRGVINASPTIKNFIINHKEIFGNQKLVHGDGSNFFDEILSISPLSESENYKDALKTRLEYQYGLTEDEIIDMMAFFEEFKQMEQSPDVKKIIDDTEVYKDSIERAWKSNESRIMKYVKSTLGYEPESIGKVSTYIVYPNFDTHRCYQLSSNKTLLFFAKSGETDPNKILAFLTHQAVHQPILPYKPTMTQKDKEIFHSFIKFLTDKDVYNYLSGKSYLDIVTRGENPEVMAKVYPFWLGYRYRNIDKQGEDPVQAIQTAINRDKAYFDKLPENSKKRKLYSKYEFEKLDARKIAVLFRERRGITPYQFAKLDFNRDSIYKEKYVNKKSTVSPTTDGR